MAPIGADLGGACIKCGHPHAPNRRHIELNHIPTLAWLALFSPPLFLIVALLSRKRSSHWITLCDSCTRAWNQSERGGIASAFAFFGSMIATGALLGANFVTAGLGMFLGGPAIAIAGIIASRRGRLTASRIDAHEVRIEGASKAYPAGGQPALLPPAVDPR